MNPNGRCVRVALVAATLICLGDGRASAQQRVNGPSTYDAAAHRAANRLEGVGDDPEALLGAPAALDERYRSAYDAADRGDQALRGAQRVPRGALAGDRYGPQPAVRGKGKARGAPPPASIDDDPRNAKVDPGTQTPMGSARSLYRGPGDAGNAAGQVYKMPW